MLTRDIIRANEGLKDLTDEQISAIETLSKNDEDQVIGNRIGEVYRRFDGEINEATGIAKLENEKTYEYNKRVLGDLKSKSGGTEELSKEIQTYKSQISDLEKKVADGSTDETLKRNYSDLQAKLKTVETEYDTVKKQLGQKDQEFSEKIKMMTVDRQYDSASSRIKFKKEIPESTKDMLLSSAKRDIYSSYSPDFVKAEGEEKETLVFRNEKGEIAVNKENLFKPYTMEELINSKLKDVIDTGVKAKGAGTGHASVEGAEAPAVLDFGAVKTQVQADEMIKKHLLQQGLTKLDPKYSEEFKKIREEGKVIEMPTR